MDHVAIANLKVCLSSSIIVNFSLLLKPLPQLSKINLGLPQTKGVAWRSLRQILSPTFSSLKIKAVSYMLDKCGSLYKSFLLQMIPIIHKSVRDLVEVFQKQADTNQSVEVFRCFNNIMSNACIHSPYCRKYGDFAMEATVSTALGRVIDIQRGESDKLTEAATTVLRSMEEGSKFSLIDQLILFSKNHGHAYICSHF